MIAAGSASVRSAIWSTMWTSRTAHRTQGSHGFTGGLCRTLRACSLRMGMMGKRRTRTSTARSTSLIPIRASWAPGPRRTKDPFMGSRGCFPLGSSGSQRRNLHLKVLHLADPSVFELKPDQLTSFSNFLHSESNSHDSHVFACCLAPCASMICRPSKPLR